MCRPASLPLPAPGGLRRAALRLWRSRAASGQDRLLAATAARVLARDWNII